VQYPVNLVLDGRRCLVVGGGKVALRKVEGLVACGGRVTVVAPRINPALRALDGVVIDERPWRPDDMDGMWLVIAATDDPSVNRAVYDAGQRAGVWVNGADDPANCSFTLPAVVRRGPIMVTAGTGGHSPALATWLRRHMERELDDAWVVLAELLAERRAELRAAGVPTEGLSWQAVLDSGMLEVVRAGRLGDARELLRTTVVAPDHPSDAGDEGRCT
jgi:precorrin-2 dehydrogenase/sirohydrochlorin ferrochelatase